MSLPGPTTGLLDLFARTQNPIASGWLGPISSADGQLQANGTACQGTVAADYSSSYWYTVYGTNQEAYFTYNTDSDARLFLRLTAPGALAYTMYAFWFQVGINTIGVRQYLNGSNNFTLASYTPTVALGTNERVLVRSRGTATVALEVWRDPARNGKWFMEPLILDTGPPAALQGGGYLGAELFDTSVSRVFGSFGGGNYTEADVLVPGPVRGLR